MIYFQSPFKRYEWITLTYLQALYCIGVCVSRPMLQQYIIKFISDKSYFSCYSGANTLLLSSRTSERTYVKKRKMKGAYIVEQSRVVRDVKTTGFRF